FLFVALPSSCSSPLFFRAINGRGTSIGYCLSPPSAAASPLPSSCSNRNSSCPSRTASASIVCQFLLSSIWIRGTARMNSPPLLSNERAIILVLCPPSPTARATYHTSRPARNPPSANGPCKQQT